MGLVARRAVTPGVDDIADVDDRGETITAGTFWPVIELERVRREMRINGNVTTTRLKHAATEAVVHVTRELSDWRRAQEVAGHLTMADVPADEIGDESVNLFSFRHAVNSITRALLIENYRDVDSTGDGEKRAATLSTQRDDLWRDARWSIADILGRPRMISEVC